MPLYLLDTNIWIALAKGDPVAMARIKAATAPRVRTCAIVRAELFFGARKSRQVAGNLSTFQALLQPIDSIPFDDLAAEHYGSIRAELESAGTPIGHNDCMIAAIARARDLVLVTRNTREFVRVAGLRVEAW